MWLLTGDQQDTAINIGLSSCLLNNNSNIMILNDKTYSRCEKTLERYIEEMKNNDEWGYPMIKFQKKDKDKDEDYSILYDEKHDKNFNNSKISSSWEKNVLVVNGDALAAIFGSRPVKKDKNRSNSKTQELTKNYNCLTHNINNDSTDDSADMNNEKSNGKKGMVKKRPFLFNIIPFLKKTNSNKIYPEYSNPDNSNSDSKIIKRNEEDNNNSNSNSSSNSINKNNKNSTIKFLNINKIFMKSIDNIRKVLILLRINHGQRDGEKDEKKEEEKNKKKKNNEPYNPKNLTPLQRKFIEVGVRCRTVICCRVTPIQKANVVKAVRHNLNAVTLAIGDGANDVAMIQAAHVGVGIMGREGAQAVRASDYAFLEFRFLKPLLCVHGRYTFLQITKLILYSFYKNIVLSLILFSYGFVSLWSGNVSIIEKKNINIFIYVYIF